MAFLTIDTPFVVTRRPVTSTAWLLTLDNIHEVARWCGGMLVRNGTAIEIGDIHEAMVATPGCVVVQGVNGGFTPIDRAAFDQSYIVEFPLNDLLGTWFQEDGDELLQPDADRA